MSSLRRLLVAASLAMLGTATATAAPATAGPATWNVSLTEGHADGLRAGSTLRLAAPHNLAPARALEGYSRWGSYLSSVYTSRSGLGRVQVFYDAAVPAGSAVRVEVRAGSGADTWQPWQELNASGATLTLAGAPRLLQVRVVLLGGVAEPQLSRLSLTLTPAGSTAEAAAASYEAASAPTAPTFRVFATREGLVGHRTANGHIIRPRDRFVALPNWGVVSRGGGYEYQVRITYRGRTTVAPVWDVGPWNTRDDYWGPARKTYADLPVGKPMAQAAYQNGYNGGRDEFGRRIALPNGIDIADGTFWDDLGMTGEDWVEVSFLWLGRDPVEPAAPPDVSDAAALADNGRDWYDATPGDWGVAACGLNGNHNWASSVEGDPTLRASWTGQLPQPGVYEALAYIPSCGPTASSEARYQVSHDGAQSEVVVDQLANQGRWVSLGAYHFGGSGKAQVALGNQGEGDARALRFDAVKWVPRSDTAAPQSQISKLAVLPDGGFLVRWEGSDDTTGIAGYDVQWRKIPAGPWTDWHLGASIEQDRFLPPQPGDYELRVRAHDWAGNVESWPDSPDADTRQAGAP